ncbi:hypothetical protein FK220_016090 [Flavobacteriaceae bacterium TP-CH-4]|uniref:Lipoprotein n=1 Tax=Pelagihabitans pacificus TaxID=2696054 RepID=A0A967AWY5_9FLAO|nr:hypothetical protein [Pelagihabitans pacificus]NHF60875.1 hypothetical protein [Pelagihabitans pacificus]
MRLGLLIPLVVFLSSCSNDQKPTEFQKHTVPIKSDVLLESTAKRPSGGSNIEKQEELRLTISGKTILEGTATLKVIDHYGAELRCKTFPAYQLIQKDYRTANSALREVHIREVVQNYFEKEDDLAILK